MPERNIWGEAIEIAPNPFMRLVEAQSLADILPPDCFEVVETRASAAKRMVATAVVAGAIAGAVGKYGGSVVKAAPAAPGGGGAPIPAVAIYDDSLGVGRESAGEQALLEAAGIGVSVFDAIGGRQTIYAPCETDPSGEDCMNLPDVSRALDRDRELLQGVSAIAIRTGTNDRVAELEAELLATSRKAAQYGADGDGTMPLIILAETFGQSPRVGAGAKGMIVHKVAETLRAEDIPVAVLDYQEFIEGVVRPAGGVAGDEVHLSPSGYQLMAEYDAQTMAPLIRDRHAKLYPPAAPPVAPNPEPIAPPAVTPSTTPPEPVRPPAQPAIDPGLAAFTFAIEPASQRQPAAIKPSNLEAFSFEITTPSNARLARPAVSKPSSFNFPITAIDQPNALPKVSDITTDIEPQFAAQPLPIYEAPAATITPEVTTAPEVANYQEIIDLAAQNGIFYEDGQARQYLGAFVDPSEVPKLIISEPFGDMRDLGNGPFRQGNIDFKTNKREAQLLAPAAGIVETTYNDGEGNKVIIRMGEDPETGLPFRWYATHLSEFAVEPGQIVLPGDLLGRSGQSGETRGIHNSIGITSHFTDPNEYINFQEAAGQHVLDFSPSLEYECPPLEDNLEICGPTIPGEFKSLPVPSEVLDLLGLPKYLEAGLLPETPVSPSDQGLLFTISKPADINLPRVDDLIVLPEIVEPRVEAREPERPVSVFDDFGPSDNKTSDNESSDDRARIPVVDLPTVNEVIDETADPIAIEDLAPTPVITMPPEELPLDPAEAPQPASPAEPVPEQLPANPEAPAVPEGLYPNEVAIPLALRSMYWIDENGGVHAEQLLQFIRDNFAMPAESDMFRENSRYRIPDEIPGVGYRFSDIASFSERYANEWIVATVIIMALEYETFEQEFEARTGEQIDDDLGFSDADSDHNEHHHGDDIDWLLINNKEARYEFTKKTADWQRPGGEPWFRHIVTGEAELERVGDAFVTSVGQERPNFNYQSNHGSNPSNDGHHMHLSTGPGYSGPFDTPASNVPLTYGLEYPEPAQSRPMNWEALQVLGQQVANQVLGPINPPAPEPAPEPPVPEVSPAQARREMLNNDPLTFMPEQWRTFFWETASRPENSENDARVVAAVLWVENRGWPEDPYAMSAISSADARSWFQILSQTWFGWNTGVDSWYGPNGEENYLNEELYSSSGVGRDGNGDGIRNPDDPSDATAAAFQVIPGTLGDPIAFEGISGDPTQDIYSAMFEKDTETFLARCANYNGDGRTPNHKTLEQLANHRAQNPDYIRMCAALLMTDLQYGIILDREGPGFTWVNAQTGQPVSPEEVRTVVVG